MYAILRAQDDFHSDPTTYQFREDGKWALKEMMRLHNAYCAEKDEAKKKILDKQYLYAKAWALYFSDHSNARDYFRKN